MTSFSNRCPKTSTPAPTCSVGIGEHVQSRHRPFGTTGACHRDLEPGHRSCEPLLWKTQRASGDIKITLGGWRHLSRASGLPGWDLVHPTFHLLQEEGVVLVNPPPEKTTLQDAAGATLSTWSIPRVPPFFCFTQRDLDRSRYRPHRFTRRPTTLIEAH